MTSCQKTACLPLLVGGLLLTTCSVRSGKTVLPSDYTRVHQPPRIAPDYSDIVIPPNIAPLNFVIHEPAEQHIVHFHADHGEPVTVATKNMQVRIPIKPWKKLLNSNRGQQITLDIYSKMKNGAWNRFPPLHLDVAEEKIDAYISYRLLEPQFKFYDEMGLYQRNLENFKETCFLHNRVTGENCMNCHTFYKNQTGTMIFHMRSGPASGTMLIQDGSIRKINTATKFNKAGAYASWHPDGHLIAFSVNQLREFFHAKGACRDVIDMKSDLILYDIQSNQITTCPMISDPHRMETFPHWSPDGKYLYYCSAPEFKSFFKEDGDLAYDKIRYDLMCIPYHQQTGQFGDPVLVISSEKAKKSISIPRISPDGRYLLFCMSNYGSFPIYRPDSDLYVLDLETGRVHKPDINSDHATDSYHSWSSNSRWVVFSSKRENPLCARPFISYVDENGKFHKPFLVPQKDPAFYRTYMMTYNVPEFSRDPVRFSWQKLTRIAFDNDKTIGAQLDPRIPLDGTTEATPETETWKQKPPE